MIHSLRGLYGIVDAGFRPEIPLSAKLEAFVAGGAGVVQLRMKGAGSRALYDAAVAAQAWIAGRASLIVNDRPDIALAAGADGVHVGEEDLPVAEARRVLGTGKILGATVRTLEQARRAAEDGADYVGFGPMFATDTKTIDVAPRSLAMLKEVASGIGIPVVAIGGITLENAPAIAAAGASAIAVVSDVLGAADPIARARALSRVFG